jgi:tRNA dimethylallyltransferase
MDTEKTKIVLVVGPTASGKSKEAIRIAKERDGEVISVDSRQVYRGLDIGTEKITAEEMSGIPHYLIDIREPNEPYSAGDFVADSKRLISDITERGKLPILAGGSHFYIDALLYGLPEIELNEKLREELELLSDEELISEVQAKDSARFARLDPQNRRRLIRALEIIRTRGSVPERTKSEVLYEVEWVILNPERDVLRARIEERLAEALQRGLIEEVGRGPGPPCENPHKSHLETAVSMN